MHVLIPVVSRFRQLTGICRHAVNHAKAIADLPEISAVTMIAGGWQRYFDTALTNSSEKISVITARCRNDSLSRNVWYARELPKLASSLGSDIVHLSYPVPLRRSRFAMPVALTLHDLYPFDCPENFGFPGVILNRRFLHQCIDEADAIACVSANTRERLAHYFPDSSYSKLVMTIHSYSELHRETMVRPNIPHEHFILAVGQHRKNKNLDVLLNAYRQFVSSRPAAAALVVVGAEGPQTHALKKLASGLSDRITFLQAVSDAELLWLYRNCHAFVAASSIEGFCLPVLEAMESSACVVCSDIPVFREVAGSNCHFFSLQGRPDANLFAALSKLSNNGLHPSPASGTRFNRETAARKYSDLYSQLFQISSAPLHSKVAS